jgi:tRNA-modifying protein YgfZ
MTAPAESSGRLRAAPSGLGALSVAGTDAGAFLQAQLTQNIASLDVGMSRLSGWCDARGRLRAVMSVLRRHDAYLLLVPAESVESLRDQLAVYVLRADVRIHAEHAIDTVALLGPARAWLDVHAIALGGARGDAYVAGDVGVIRVGAELLYVTGPPRAVESLVGGAERTARDAAEIAEIGLGLPRLAPGLAAVFIPQMLNLDRLGAVALDKGCYPGQEVIARTHNLGTVKRRMRRFAAALDEAPEPGTEIRDRAAETAGQVLRAAAAPEGVELLAVVMVEAPGADLHVAGHPDCPLAELALPY